MKRLRTTLALPILFFASLAMAGIEWERTEATLAVHPAQLKAEVEFRFRNTGKEAVDLLSLRPSCGCISIYPGKKRYLPGESGSLKVVFDLASRIGRQRKSVRVATSDAPEKTTHLYLNVNIPEGYRLSASRLLWKENQREPRTITLSNVSGQPIAIGKASSSDPRLRIKLETIREGFEYRIELTPAPEMKQARSVIRIETVPPEGMEESKGYRIYALIK